MLRKMCSALFVYLVVTTSIAHTDSSSSGPSQPKKYTLSICAVFKNEARYLKEWIEYHQLVGVDHFYLYTNNTSDRSLNVLRPYIKKGVVTLTNWPDFLGDLPEEKTFMWALATQTSAFEHAIHVKGKEETKWLAIVDISEFLVPIQSMKLLDILERYDEYPGITLTSDHFDGSRIDITPKRNLLIETIEMIGDPQENIQKSFEKTIFKPEMVASFTWPPYKCCFKNNQPALALSGSEMRVNHYANRYMGYLHFAKARDKLYIDNRLLADSKTREILQGNYEIEDQERVIHRFIPPMLKRMGFDSSWKWD